jgi:hypothetical protein
MAKMTVKIDSFELYICDFCGMGFMNDSQRRTHQKFCGKTLINKLKEIKDESDLYKRPCKKRHNLSE